MKNKPPPPQRHKPGRKSRAKADTVWQNLPGNANGVYQETYDRLHKAFPELTKMEVKICVLILDGLDSWEIKDALIITVHRVENHRSEIRKKLGVKHKDKIKKFLLAL